ncbi:MAG: indole-3-glycerol phosphate synthase TrpC [Candidatus Latescibacterota bacterium]|nr:indole-3-glycerol phosphate synthase TrpC [Candidatus Latescibacterota bacterium]
MMDILEEIAHYKREFVTRRQAEKPLVEVVAEVRDCPPTQDFAGALAEEGVALIAEVKKASPSKGIIREDFDPEMLASEYAANGASALSVLTDEAYFQGCNAHLQSARAAGSIPVLRKDFTVDPYQIHEARVIGADAILLIVALMDGGQLEDFLGIGTELGLSVLVEVHTREELERALSAQAALVGINNRDLHTFETRLETTFELSQFVPPDTTLVSESGVNTRSDVEALQAAQVAAVLVGEAIMREEDVGAKVRELTGRGEGQQDE